MVARVASLLAACAGNSAVAARGIAVAAGAPTPGRSSRWVDCMKFGRSTMPEPVELEVRHAQVSSSSCEVRQLLRSSESNCRPLQALDFSPEAEELFSSEWLVCYDLLVVLPQQLVLFESSPLTLKSSHDFPFLSVSARPPLSLAFDSMYESEPVQPVSPSGELAVSACRAVAAVLEAAVQPTSDGGTNIGDRDGML